MFFSIVEEIFDQLLSELA